MSPKSLREREREREIVKDYKFSSFLFQESGIDKIIPGMVIDDFLFDPCGYSMNGVAKDVSGF